MTTLAMPTEKGFFALRMKQLREDAKLSQAELAERCGIGLSTVRQFEYGLREPTFETLVKLASGLGVGLAAFDQAAIEEPKPAPKRRRKE